ncbi:MAG: ABC transporter substrate-binding protein [Bacteroidota bacterium]|nr:ABC transporter substrate-binding protein [Bacteroidota bacterium]MDP4235593.1 ABC transporter substrate-binding protein [Bacteroidota bacterium]
MKLRHSLAAIFTFLLLATFLTACKKEGGASGNEILIGEYASINGQNATFGRSSHNGTVLAIDEINTGGGILGKQIKLMSEDDNSKQEEATSAVQKLINHDKVVALLGEVASSRSRAGGQIAQQAKIPMISPASTNEEVTRIGDYIFRICFIDPFQGEALANFSMKTLHATRAAILLDTKQDYSIGLANSFRETMRKNGGAIVSEQAYSSGDKDFRAALTSIRASNPDVIFIPGYYSEVSLIVRQARELGITCPLVGGDGWDSSELTKGAEKEFNGTYFSNHFSTEDPDPAVQNFIKKYKAKYSNDPDAMSALGYDAANILADAIKRAGSTDAKKLRDAIAATKDFAGVTGSITINAERNALKPLTILQIVDGKYHFAQRISATGEPMTEFKPMSAPAPAK